MIPSLNYLRSGEAAVAVSAANQLDALREEYFVALKGHELFGYAGFSLSTDSETFGPDSVIAAVRVHHKVFRASYEHVWLPGDERELHGRLIFWRQRTDEEKEREPLAPEFTVRFNTGGQFWLTGAKGVCVRAEKAIFREPDVARLLIWLIKEAQATLPTLPTMDLNTVNP